MPTARSLPRPLPNTAAYCRKGFICPGFEGHLSISDSANGTPLLPFTRLDAIKAKPHSQRNEEEMALLLQQDARLAEIYTKKKQERSSAEIEYVQQSTGTAHTFSTLTPCEKALYDELVALGEWMAAQGVAGIAFVRYAAIGSVSLPNGLTFDPQTTSVTAENLRDLFRFSLIDPSGNSARRFEALALFLEHNTPQRTPHPDSQE